MYRKYVDETRDAINELRDYAKAIEYLSERRKNLEDMLNSVDELIRDFSITDEAKQATEIVSKEAFDILKRTAREALRKTKEFNIPIFRDRLMAAIDNPETIKITWNATKRYAEIKIDLLKTAGTPADYGRAIREARKELGVGNKGDNPVADAALASYMWMEKYYKPAREGSEIPQPKRKPEDPDRTRKVRSDKKERREYNTEQYKKKYWRTIRMRVSKFKGLAPFWFILEYGQVALPSDYGGTPYPQPEATRFVEKAQRQIRRVINKHLKESKNYIEDLRKEKLEIEKAIRHADHLTNTIVERLSATVENPKTQKEFGLVEIKRRLGERYGRASVGRILKVVNGLIAGEIDPKRRVYVGKKGQVLRIRVKQLYDEIMEFQAGL